MAARACMQWLKACSHLTHAQARPLPPTQHDIRHLTETNIPKPHTYLTHALFLSSQGPNISHTHSQRHQRAAAAHTICPVAMEEVAVEAGMEEEEGEAAAAVGRSKSGRTTIFLGLR